MAVSVDYLNKVITIPKADLTLVSGTLFELDTNAFRLELASLQDDEEGVAHDTMYRHNTEVTVAGVTYARTIEMINGWQVEFEDLPNYSVRLSGSNNNIFDVNAGVLVQNQVQVISNNSAGLIGGQQNQDTAFGDQRVWIDVVAGSSGTQYPLGTTANPVNNLADAQAIIAARPFMPKRLHVRGNLTIGVSDSVSGYDIRGAGIDFTTITVSGGGVTTGATIRDLEVTGNLSGAVQAVDCLLDTISDVEGTFIRCGLKGLISIVIGGQPVFVDCYQNQPNTGVQINAVGQTGIQATFRGWRGQIQFVNVTQADNDYSLDVQGGKVTVSSSCTDGTFFVRGNASILDQSTGSANVQSVECVQPEDTRTAADQSTIAATNTQT